MMRKIGKVVRLQIQTGSLKQGQPRNRYYDPSPLQSLTELQLDSWGVTGMVEGQEVLDVHNVRHPQTKNSRQINSISFNFTTHYQKMQTRFGSHLTLGCAGENILIEPTENFTDGPFELSIFAESEVVIEDAEGHQASLSQICMAAPCEPFSRYVLEQELFGMPPESAREQMKETLQFLNHGTRGFYCQQVGEPFTIHVGDGVYIR